MPRFEDDGPEVGLRQWLLEWEVEFRELYGEVSPEAMVELSKGVNQLSRSEAFRLYGWQLPDDHPARLVYGVNANLVLTENDELIPR